MKITDFWDVAYCLHHQGDRLAYKCDSPFSYFEFRSDCSLRWLDVWKLIRFIKEEVGVIKTGFGATYII
jgi:hypothetical protein